VRHLGRFALLSLVWTGLLAWDLAAERLGCGAAAVAIALLAGLLMLSGTEAAFYRRRAFIGHFLEPRGLLFCLLSRRALIVTRQLVQAVALALVLLVAAIGFDRAQWLLLAADIPVLAALLTGLSSLLGREVRAPYREPMARHWAARTNALLLWVSWMLLLYYTPQENYADLRWEEVLAFGAAQPAIGCDALAVLARLAAVAEALAQWSAQQLFSGLKDPLQVLMAWTIFLAAFGASFLVAWTYTRALMGALARPWSVWPHSTGVSSP
jgi:hypothetical protein